MTSAQIIGMIGTHEVSEIHARTGDFVQPDFVRAVAQAHEDAGFDTVLVGYDSSGADGSQVAAYAAAHTDRLGFLLAHRPGVVSPTLSARTLATLDQFTRGRVSVHIVTGGADVDQRREGDYLSKDERYARTDEYMTLLRRAWSSDEPFDAEGPVYRFEGFRSAVRPWQDRMIPLYFGGSSVAALGVGARQADVFMLYGEPLAGTAEQIANIRAAARAAGRTDGPGFSVSFRPILAATDEAAWERAHRILATIRGSGGGLGAFVASTALVGTGDSVDTRPQSVASQRLLDAAAKGELHDRCLWTPTAQATNAAGNTMALVGTPETVALALADYAELGVSTFLIRGFDPLADATDYGRELVPRLRELLSRSPVEAAS